MPLLIFVCGAALAADQDYYHRMLSIARTNEEAFELTSPLLVDTNNTGYKLTNTLVHLATVRTNGQLSGVGPGMTMDQVVARWGKPLQLWIRGFPGPRFVYKEVSVFFDPAKDSAKTVYTHDLPSLERMLDVQPKLEECVLALGNPSYREDSTAANQCYLIYERANLVIKVGCVRGRLSTLQIDQPD